jgi:hypothetical protein
MRLLTDHVKAQRAWRALSWNSSCPFVAWHNPVIGLRSVMACCAGCLCRDAVVSHMRVLRTGSTLSMGLKAVWRYDV